MKNEFLKVYAKLDPRPPLYKGERLSFQHFQKRGVREVGSDFSHQKERVGKIRGGSVLKKGYRLFSY